jgi:hypothetical protein
MTIDDIIRMAKEAGGDDWGIFRDFMPEIERFAELVAAAEREACAKVCASFDLAPSKPTSYTIRKQVEAIRARGQE